jgi:Transglutaminase-like superfamily/TgpA N-terminal domain
MQDAAIDKLSKLISDPRPGDKKRRRLTLHMQFSMEEGWFSLFLLATVVYSTIWSVQAAGWVDHLNILTLTTALGLIAGLIASKQHRLPSIVTHLIAVVLGLLIAFWQTAGAFYSGSTAALVQAIHSWLVTALAGSSVENDAIFLLFITALAFILAYTSAWLVYRLRSPWLAIVANAVVLLINLSNIAPGYTLFLIVFLMAALLLLLRFNLRESVLRWRRHGLRYADDLSWDVMQAGTLISIGILIFAWLLPWGYINDAAAQVWNTDSNPWVQLENTWDRIVSVNANYNPSNHGNFRDTLVLAGNPNLNHDIVFKVQSDDPTQYLESLSYTTYDGHGWSIGSTANNTLNANQTVLSETQVSHPVKQDITVVNSPGEQFSYLFGSPQIASVSVPATMVSTKNSDTAVAWLSKNGALASGQKYTVYSYVSTADVNSLRTVPLPANATTFPSNYDGQYPLTYYDPSVVSIYTQLPSGLDPNILLLAKNITAHAPTMYDKALALENYFRTHFTYDLNIQVPPGQEPVSWFLFRSGNKGYCNYFATSMVVMARELGMPARVVVGYTNGTYDTASHQDIIRGTDAHAWPQIYFAGYGWINFEPSASFSTFSRPLPGQFTSSSLPPIPVGSLGSKTSVKGKGFASLPQDTGSESAVGATSQSQLGWRQQVGLAFGGLVLLLLFACILFGLWWQRLFRRLGLVRQIYGRILLMANWAGIELQRSQTPYESMHMLAQASPGEAVVLERLGDIYVRELWADPQSMEHPLRSGEENELPSLWKRLQPRLLLYVLKHPYFLRRLPDRITRLVRKQWRRSRARRLLDQQEM